VLHESVMENAVKMLSFTEKTKFSPEDTAQVVEFLLADVRLSLEELASLITQRKDSGIPNSVVESLLHEAFRCLPKELDESHVHSMQKLCGDEVLLITHCRDICMCLFDTNRMDGMKSHVNCCSITYRRQCEIYYKKQLI